MNINFYDINNVNNDLLKFVVIGALYKNKWIFVKHKERNTWEIPGGHIEEGENYRQAAYRELYEETGAKDFSIIPICIYSVEIKGCKSYGVLNFSLVKELGELPDFEIEKVRTFENLPNELTYPEIQPYLYKKLLDFIKKTV